MSVVRCQDCGIAISRYCRKCPHCCARNPAFRRRSALAMVILVLLLAGLVFLVKNLKTDEGSVSGTVQNLRPNDRPAPTPS